MALNNTSRLSEQSIQIVSPAGITIIDQLMAPAVASPDGDMVDTTTTMNGIQKSVKNSRVWTITFETPATLKKINTILSGLAQSNAEAVVSLTNASTDVKQRLVFKDAIFDGLREYNLFAEAANVKNTWVLKAGEPILLPV